MPDTNKHTTLDTLREYVIKFSRPLPHACVYMRSNSIEEAAATTEATAMARVRSFHQSSFVIHNRILPFCVRINEYHETEYATQQPANNVMLLFMFNISREAHAPKRM